jgi:hypothetical protein
MHLAVKVFIISPTDKGGQLFMPPAKFAKVGCPLAHPTARDTRMSGCPFTAETSTVGWAEASTAQGCTTASHAVPHRRGDSAVLCCAVLCCAVLCSAVPLSV